MRALLICLLTTSMVLAAPLPPPRPERPVDRKPPAFLGFWRMKWFGQYYYASFEASGYHQSFTRLQDGEIRYWDGTWRLEGDTLIVRDRPLGCDPETNWNEWRVLLEPCQKKGAINSGWPGAMDTFRLERTPKGTLYRR